MQTEKIECEVAHMAMFRAVPRLFMTIAIGLGVCSAPLAAIPGAKVREAIAAANSSFVAAAGRGDGAAAAGVYSEGAQLLPPNQPIVNGREGIRSFWQSAFDSGVKEAKLETVELSGRGDWVYEVGNYRLFDGKGAELDNGKYLVVWVREKRSWRLHRDIWNSSRSPSGT